MTKPLSSAEVLSPVEVLDREYLPTRAKILEVAAALDRVGRTAGEVADDPRWQQLQSALEAVLKQDAQRAERVQIIFSREYHEGWREELGVPQP